MTSAQRWLVRGAVIVAVVIVLLFVVNLLLSLTIFRSPEAIEIHIAYPEGEVIPWVVNTVNIEPEQIGCPLGFERERVENSVQRCTPPPALPHQERKDRILFWILALQDKGEEVNVTEVKTPPTG